MREIQIKQTPEAINISGIKIKQNECIINSFSVVKNNNNVKFVEGLIINFDIYNNAVPTAHAWNKIDETYFDVTNDKIWIGRETLKEIKETKYFVIREYDSNELENGKLFEFSKETIENINAIKEITAKNEANSK